MLFCQFFNKLDKNIDVITAELYFNVLLLSNTGDKVLITC